MGVHRPEAERAGQRLDEEVPEPAPVGADDGELLGHPHGRAVRLEVRPHERIGGEQRGDHRDRGADEHLADTARRLALTAEGDERGGHDEVGDVRARPDAEADRRADDGVAQHPTPLAHTVRGESHHQPERDRRDVEELLAHAEPHRRGRRDPHQQGRELGLALGQPVATEPPDEQRVDRHQDDRRDPHRPDRPAEELHARHHGDDLDGAPVELAPEEGREPVVGDVADHQGRDDLVRVRPPQGREQDDRPEHDARDDRRRDHPPIEATVGRVGSVGSVGCLGSFVADLVQRLGEVGHHLVEHAGRRVRGVGAHSASLAGGVHRAPPRRGHRRTRPPPVRVAGRRSCPRRARGAPHRPVWRSNARH